MRLYNCACSPIRRARHAPCSAVGPCVYGCRSVPSSRPHRVQATRQPAQPPADRLDPRAPPSTIPATDMSVFGPKPFTARRFRHVRSTTIARPCAGLIATAPRARPIPRAHASSRSTPWRFSRRRRGAWTCKVAGQASTATVRCKAELVSAAYAPRYSSVTSGPWMAACPNDRASLEVDASPRCTSLGRSR